MNNYNGEMWTEAGPAERTRLLLPFGALVQVAYDETLQEVSRPEVAVRIATENLLLSGAIHHPSSEREHHLRPAGRFLLHVGSTVATETTNPYGADFFTPEQEEWIAKHNIYFKTNHHREFVSSAFASLGYFMRFVDEATHATFFSAQYSDKIVATLETDWFLRILKGASAAPQSFWEIPRFGRGEDYALFVAHRGRRKALLLRQQTDAPAVTKAGEGWQLSAPAIEAMSRIKIKKIKQSGADSNQDTEQRFARASSGCPVRHGRLDKAMLARALSSDQVARVMDSGLYEDSYGALKLKAEAEPFKRTISAAAYLIQLGALLKPGVEADLSAGKRFVHRYAWQV